MLPLNIILIRHGESEGNLAKNLALEDNNNKLFDKLEYRRNPFYRLTNNGIKQIIKTGEWIKKNIHLNIDKYFTSEYIRALETSVNLNINGAIWNTNSYLRERDNGILSGLSPDYKNKNYSDEMIRKDETLFYYSPPGGESVVNCMQRANLFVNHLEYNKYNNILAVCHGGIMNSFRLLFENIRNTDFDKINNMKSGSEHIHNGHILWYSRVNPFTKEIHDTYKWLYSICPYKNYDDYNINNWNEINIKSYTNEDLKIIIDKIKPIT